MDEYGESAAWYIWPTGHEDGTPWPDDFYGRVRDALRAAGLECESV